MKSLVTGGAGFIGSHLVDALVERGDDVLAVDDLSTGRRANLDEALANGARFEQIDVRDGEGLRKAAEEYAPEAVFHLAAQIDVRVAVERPGFDAELNVAGTVNALEVARRHGARFAFASTGGAIYGEGDERPLPFTEEAECLPDSPYGQSKLAAEGYVSYYRRVHGLAATSLRFGNVFGPRQDPAGEAGVIAIFCGKAVGGGKPTVFGTGEQTRDYIYVGDVVSGMVAGSGHEGAGPLNLGTGVETSVLRLVELIGSLAGRDDFAPEMAPAREGEVERTVLDPSLAENELGWQAETTLERGLEATVEAMRRELTG